MIIEETTTYAYKLKYIENVSFNRIRAFAQSFVNELPQELVDDIYEQLNRGLDLLQNEPQMLVYLYSFGNMHQAKLNRAFEQLPDAFLQQHEIRIVDYGCGQAIGTMCYADYLAERHLSQTIKSVTLIEPSEICLKRAALHVSQFFPDAEIHTFCKTFNDLTDDDIANSDDIPTLHILSNVLDIQAFDLEDFANLIANDLSNYNQFVCVGPYFNYSDKDERMRKFAELLDGNVSYSQIFEKGKLCEGKTWTAQIACFSVGELEDELSTEVTEEEIRNGIEDEFGAIYSKDGKRLLKCYEPFVEDYVIKEGTKIICDEAFEDCYVESDGFVCNNRIRNIGIPDSVIMIGKRAFATCFELEKLILPKSLVKLGGGLVSRNTIVSIESRSNRFIVIDKMIIDRTRKQIIHYFGDEKYFEIPNTVTSIANEAFYLCTFQDIIIPATVTTIGNGAFYYCNSLQQITIPDSVRSIGDGAFCDCGALKQIVLPNYITSIRNWVFRDCKSLQQITIPNSVTSIGEWAFGGCKSLQQITIPDSVTSIGKNAFSSCESLQQITIPDSVTRIGDGAFSNCNSLQQITIPNSVINIGDGAFSNCKSLQQITIPDSVTTRIGDGAFSCCVNLNFKSNSKRYAITDKLLIDNIERRLIWYFGTDECLLIPNYVTSIGNMAFVSCKSLQQITIPDSVTSIGEKAFCECESLQQITIPDSVTSIGNRAFRNCKSLQQITIPDSVISIGEEIFYGCKSLQQITILGSVTSIGDLAFESCESLQQITIPDSVTSIGNLAFEECKSLQQITIPNSVTSIGIRAFTGCESLRQITIPDSVTSIGNRAFSWCKSLQQITIPDSVTSIGEENFSRCKSLQQITIPSSVTSIGERAFEWCKSLKQITIPNSVTSIGNWAFLDCDSLQQIIIPEGSAEKFKKMLPEYLWDKLYYLKKAE